jgi:catechol 2,3-dioxygenase-like lactoylglutathione lyase family enzyme
VPGDFDHVFAGVPVSDYAAALAWWERFFGREADVPVDEEEAMWQLVGAGWVYVVGDADRAGNGLLTMLVADLDAFVAELAARGIAADPVDTAPGAVRRVRVADPDGNRITVGQTP